MEKLEKIKLEILKNKFFPGHHLYSRGFRGVKPLYNVVCNTWRDYLDARRVKPKFVKARITFQPK
jgi:hypothetical protein